VTEQKIRPLAIGVFSHGDKIFVFEGYDPAKDEVFYRPLGGMIEFGEYGREALAREIMEEIGQKITNLRYLGSLENIFVFDGERGHEIVLVYDGEFLDRSIYREEVVEGYEDDMGGLTFKAMWKSLDTFHDSEAAPLYPDGLLELLLKHRKGI
jgi:8-oxo-dGTP pyrophosphatase MutT (NUDIX family)